MIRARLKENLPTAIACRIQINQSSNEGREESYHFCFLTKIPHSLAVLCPLVLRDERVRCLQRILLGAVEQKDDRMLERSL